MNNIFSKKNAIKGAIKDYEDNHNLAELQYYDIYTLCGFNFFIKNGEQINIDALSIFINAEREQEDTYTQDSVSVMIKSQEKLDDMLINDPRMPILSYKGSKYAFFKLQGYNEQYKTYHYQGEMLFPKNKVFFIEEEENAISFPSDSSIIWEMIKEYLDVPIYFSYNTPLNESSPYLVIAIKSTDTISKYQDEANTITLYMRDSITLTLFNSSDINAINILSRVYDMALNIKLDAPYIMSVQGNFPAWKNETSVIQNSFNIKSSIKITEIEVSYVRPFNTEDTLLLIKTIGIKINETIEVIIKNGIS